MMKLARKILSLPRSSIVRLRRQDACHESVCEREKERAVGAASGGANIAAAAPPKLILLYATYELAWRRQGLPTNCQDIACSYQVGR